MNNIYFSSKGKYYLQIFSLPMRRPCSTIFVDMFMDDLETESLYKLDFKPVVDILHIDSIRYITN